MYVCMYVLYLHRFKEHLRKEKEKFDLATKKSLEVNKRNRENNTKRDMMVRHPTYTFVCTYVCMYVCMYVCVCVMFELVLLLSDVYNVTYSAKAVLVLIYNHTTYI
jgi:hypothetical protein